jgi:hypothetical protein
MLGLRVMSKKGLDAYENCTKVKGKCRKKEENVADYDKKHQNLVFLCLNESRKM